MINDQEIALKSAKTLLLEPGGITESDLQNALNSMFTHRLDDADLYFQHTRNESWSLEEGIVKSGHFQY
jgi:TldD protein